VSNHGTISKRDRTLFPNLPRTEDVCSVFCFWGSFLRRCGFSHGDAPERTRWHRRWMDRRGADVVCSLDSDRQQLRIYIYISLCIYIYSHFISLSYPRYRTIQDGSTRDFSPSHSSEVLITAAEGSWYNQLVYFLMTYKTYMYFTMHNLSIWSDLI
jgi:hypothetical protein